MLTFNWYWLHKHKYERLNSVHIKQISDYRRLWWKLCWWPLLETVYSVSPVRRKKEWTNERKEKHLTYKLTLVHAINIEMGIKTRKKKTWIQNLHCWIMLRVDRSEFRENEKKKNFVNINFYLESLPFNHQTQRKNPLLYPSHILEIIDIKRQSTIMKFGDSG